MVCGGELATVTAEARRGNRRGVFSVNAGNNADNDGMLGWIIF